MDGVYTRSQCHTRYKRATRSHVVSNRLRQVAIVLSPLLPATAFRNNSSARGSRYIRYVKHTSLYTNPCSRLDEIRLVCPLSPGLVALEVTLFAALVSVCYTL